MEDARDFKYIRSNSLSYYGNWASFEALPDWGDGYTQVIKTSDTTKRFTIERGTLGQFSNDENWFACLIKPKSMEIENAKTPKDKPKSALKYISLDGKKAKEIEKVKNLSFQKTAIACL